VISGTLFIILQIALIFAEFYFQIILDLGWYFICVIQRDPRDTFFLPQIAQIFAEFYFRLFPILAGNLSA
jgi:hypothetical protein